MLRFCLCLKVKLMGFANNRWDVGCDRKRGTKDDSEVFNLSNVKDGGSYLVGLLYGRPELNLRGQQ